MLGLSFLSFHSLEFLVCSVALGPPCEGTLDTIDGFSYKQNFLKKIARTRYTTTQNKSLIISERFHDNLELKLYLRVCPREDQAGVIHAISPIAFKLSQFIIRIMKLFENPE